MQALRLKYVLRAFSGHMAPVLRPYLTIWKCAWKGEVSYAKDTAFITFGPTPT